MATKPKVLISGAGPVGLTLANELVRHGISVRIVDKSASRTDKSKALVLWSRTLELLDDAGYATAFLSSACRRMARRFRPANRSWPGSRST
jgi:2-polyprenyl-6-methoxyphenol hydroxylase-like FAD-dependent oxidoreductase